MTIEIERKFILSEGPPSGQLGAGVHIRQGYLAEEELPEVRHTDRQGLGWPGLRSEFG